MLVVVAVLVTSVEMTEKLEVAEQAAVDKVDMKIVTVA
jgi:hypothetical protein